MIQLSEHELIAELTAFLEGKRDLVELEAALRERVTFDRPGQIGMIRIHTSLPLVPLTNEHVLGVLSRTLSGDWSPSESTSWAAAVLVLDCFDLEGPGPAQDVLSETVWDLATDGAHNGLASARLRELMDRLLDAAA
jgi:hypothetical protein